MSMRRAALLLLLCAAGVAQAQMYKWKDAKGVTHYTDTPPPASAKKAEVKNFATGGAGAELPPELAEPARARPVVLYTAANCPGCEQGRALLNTRGIPFRERTISTAEDHAALKAAGSDGQLPLLLVGRTKQIGFESQTWDELLTGAGYPTITALPPGYQNPPPVAAAPPKQPSPEQAARAAELDAARAATEEAARRRARQPDNAPPNFQF
ncbi:MAG TPA: glutaredoxin family protein [Pseudoduganella sp.]